ncbi:MAG TPA: hypothetical protein DEV78_02295 [Clostridiales bacterium]|nr:hypothetical protein [Clostridiales bacterium]
MHVQYRGDNQILNADTPAKRGQPLKFGFPPRAPFPQLDAPRALSALHQGALNCFRRAKLFPEKVYHRLSLWINKIDKMSNRGDNQIKVTCGDMMADYVGMIALKVCMMVANAT